MYNFLVTSQDGAWEGDDYEYERSRFLEYTNSDIASRFEELKTPQIETLLKFPCLFAYEGSVKPMRVGRLLEVKRRDNGRKLYLRFSIDLNIQPIPHESIDQLKRALDIRNWELNRTHWAIKEEDLLAILNRENLADASSVAESPKIQQGDLPPVPAPDNLAASVDAFIKLVVEMADASREVFYRGHSNRTKYKLLPSLFRTNEGGEPIYRDAEDTMCRELLVSNSADFQGDVYTLDRLVRMQHYALPTRLLDITSNPLIALYFACMSNPDDQGEVISFSMERATVKYFDSDTASCIANLSRLSKASKDSLDLLNDANIADFNQRQSVKQLLHFIKEEKPYFDDRIDPEHLRSVICVKGKRTNSRISFQSGAFLLFGEEATLKEEGSSTISVARIAIENKAGLLRQLDTLNINQSTVFPYIENSAKYIAHRYRLQSLNEVVTGEAKGSADGS
ncbi:FRG domain-containing protein [Rhizobacter sp. OV335]|uniref:FRG domain-containing protein n=1 Tax=Rhizobacter sp. OV335 TaxID=1500264 RepID=UPI000911D45B|nr:FRG domain-containing protein [Rhizobacter sp. OV335]SHN30700.1 FRG domain-containing protein [Rhizobacter sp. OV335]